MRRLLLSAALLLVLAACPVQHAAEDLGQPVYDSGVAADAGAGDGAVVDAGGRDLTGIDSSAPDVLRQDVSAQDHGGPDAARPDSAVGDVGGVDTAAPDILAPDGAAADRAAADTAVPDRTPVDSALPDVAQPTDAARPDAAITPDEAGGLDSPRNVGLPLSNFPFNIAPAGDVDCFRLSFAQATLVTAETLDQASTCADMYTADTVMALYADGETNPDAYLLRDDDDGPGYCSLLQFAAEANSAYVLCVEGYSGSRSYMDLRLSVSTGPVPADEVGGLEAPQPVTLPAAGLAMSLVPGDDLDCFAFDLASHATVTAQVEEAGYTDCAYHTEVLLYAAGETERGAWLDRGAPGAGCDPLYFSLEPGGYVVCLGLQDGPPLYATGLVLSLEAASSPANDGCLGAAPLAVTASGEWVEVSGDTSSAFDLRASTLSCQSGYGDWGADLFYTFTTSAQMAGLVVLELVTTGWNGVVYAFADSCAASEDLGCGLDSTWLDVEPSTTYYVVVDAYSSGSGPFTLRARYQPPYPNATCEQAAPLTVPGDGSAVVVQAITSGDGDTRSSTVAGDRCQEAVHYAPELFYTVTAGAQEATLHVELETEGWDGALYAFADSCAATQDLACYGQEPYGFNPVWFQLPVAAQSTTFLAVDGYGDICCSAARGRFTLRARYLLPATQLEGGETCASATALLGSRGLVTGSTVAGANDLQPSDVGCWESAYGYDKFYRITLAAGQSATVRVAHSDPYNTMVVYLLRGDCPVRGDSCLDEIVIDRQVEGALSFDNTSGATADYLVVIDADYASQGEVYRLSWEIVGP